MRRIKQKNCAILVGVIILIVGIIGTIYILSRPDIQFVSSNVDIEINSEYNASEFIKEINGDISDVIIDNSQVKTDELGEYKIIYKHNDKEYSLVVNVVDKKAPEFEVANLECGIDEQISADMFVSDIKDQTKTKTYFKDEYNFKDIGEYKIVIIVEDMGKNKTEKEAVLTLIKDEEKPTLSGLKDITVLKDSKVNYLSGVTAKDNLDKEPKVDVDSSSVNLSQAGTYKVTYTVTDKSGNRNTYTNNVTVYEKKAINSVGQNSNKIVYLTFDDGPSSNTAKVLDILKNYNVKATFFVTGNGQSYKHLIKRAHDEGHTIGLHTYSHKYNLVYSSVENYFKDLDQIGQLVKNQIGFVPKFIRFPGGASNTVSRSHSKGIMTILTSEVQNRGYQYYDWNVSSEDASGNNVPVTTIVRNATSSHAKNINILFHDTAAKSTTVQALPQIIEHYQSLGYTFMGIDEKSFTPHQHVNN
ncbi:MAG: polysaccharide deacetylase [Coprobacillus sp.]